MYMVTQLVYVPMGTIYSKSGCLYGLHIAELRLTFDDNAYPLDIVGANSGQPCELRDIRSGLLTGAQLVRTINIPFNVNGIVDKRKKSDLDAIAWAKCTPEQKMLADMLYCKVRCPGSSLQYSCCMDQMFTTYIYDEQTQKIEAHTELGAEVNRPLFSPVVILLCSVGDKNPGQLFMQHPAFVLMQDDTLLPLTAQVEPTLYAMYSRYVTDEHWFRSNTVKNALGCVVPQWNLLRAELQMASNSLIIAKRYMNAPVEATLQELLGQQGNGYTMKKITEPSLISDKAVTSTALTIRTAGQHTLRTGTTAVKIDAEAMLSDTFVKLAPDTRYVILNEGEAVNTTLSITKQGMCLPVVQCASPTVPQVYGLSASCYTATNAQIAAYLKMLDANNTTLVRLVVCKPEYHQGTISYITNAKRMEVHMGEQPADAVILQEAKEFSYSFGVTRKRFQIKLQGNAAVKRSTSINRMKASLALYLPQELKNGMQLQVDMQEVTKGITMLSFVDALSHVTSTYAANTLPAIEQHATSQGFLFSPSTKNIQNLEASLLPDTANAVVQLGGSTYIELCSGLNVNITATKPIKRLYLRAPKKSSGAISVHIYANVQQLYIVEGKPVEYFIHGNVDSIIPLRTEFDYRVRQYPLQVHIKPQALTKLTDGLNAIKSGAVKLALLGVNNGSAWEDFDALTYMNNYGPRYSVPVIFGKHVVLYGSVSWELCRTAEKCLFDGQQGVVNFIADIT